jgi:hypothetical protein
MKLVVYPKTPNNRLRMTLTTAAIGAAKHKTAILVERHVHVQGDHEEIETCVEQKR